MGCRPMRARSLSRNPGARAGTSGFLTRPQDAHRSGTPRRVDPGAAGRYCRGDRCGGVMNHAIETQQLHYASAEPGLEPTDGHLRQAPSFPHHLDDHPLPTLAVPLTVKHPLPGAQIELAVRNRHDHLVADREAPQVRGGVVLPRVVVPVAGGIPRGDGFFEPLEDITPQAGFVIVHEYGRRDVHRAHEREALQHAALGDLSGDLVGDVDDLLPLLRVEPEIVGVALHPYPPPPPMRNAECGLGKCGVRNAECGMSGPASEPENGTRRYPLNSAFRTPHFLLCVDLSHERQSSRLPPQIWHSRSAAGSSGFWSPSPPCRSRWRWLGGCWQLARRRRRRGRASPWRAQLPRPARCSSGWTPPISRRGSGRRFATTSISSRTRSPWCAAPRRISATTRPGSRRWSWRSARSRSSPPSASRGTSRASCHARSTSWWAGRG